MYQGTLPDLDKEIEQRGHELRAASDKAYKRATWGLRPEDIADIAALTGEATRWATVE